MLTLVFIQNFLWYLAYRSTIFLLCFKYLDVRITLLYNFILLASVVFSLRLYWYELHFFALHKQFIPLDLLIWTYLYQKNVDRNKKQIDQ